MPGALRLFFRFWVAAHWIDKIRVAGLKAPQVDTSPALTFTDEELKRIYGACDVQHERESTAGIGQRASKPLAGRSATPDSASAMLSRWNLTASWEITSALHGEDGSPGLRASAGNLRLREHHLKRTLPRGETAPHLSSPAQKKYFRLELFHLHPEGTVVAGSTD
jgi:hypothetical protein